MARERQTSECLLGVGVGGDVSRENASKRRWHQYVKNSSNVNRWRDRGTPQLLVQDKEGGGSG